MPSTVFITLLTVLLTVLGLAIIIIFGLFFYIKRQKILVAICCIDERVAELHNCVGHLEKTDIVATKDIIGIFRKKDLLCKKFMNLNTNNTNNQYLEVDDYEISQGTRHNITGIADKRNKALEYARNNNYDKLIFIDSDIEVEWYTLLCLLFGTAIADISCVAYPFRWASMIPILGFDNPPSIQPVTYGILPFQTCAFAGMGCTCIDLRSEKIPEKFVNGVFMGFQGEDLGFFLEARKKGAWVLASKWHIVNHKY
jgi:hypothetical protein